MKNQLEWAKKYVEVFDKDMHPDEYIEDWVYHLAKAIIADEEEK